MTPLERLEEWRAEHSKHRRYDLIAGYGTGWGETFVRMIGEGITVAVDDGDLIPKTDDDPCPTIDDIITAALDKWRDEYAKKQKGSAE